MAIESLEFLDIQHVFGAKLRLAPDDAKPGGHNGWNGGERVAVFFVLLVSFANISNQSHHFCWKYWDIGFVVHVVNASYAYRLMYTTWRNHKLTSMIYCNDDIWRLFLWLRVRARSSCTGSRVSSYFQDVGKIRISQKNGCTLKNTCREGFDFNSKPRSQTNLGLVRRLEPVKRVKWISTLDLPAHANDAQSPDATGATFAEGNCGWRQGWLLPDVRY